MNDNLLTDVMTFVNAAFLADGLKVALVLACSACGQSSAYLLTSTCTTPQSYFVLGRRLLSYSLYLTASWRGRPMVGFAHGLALRCASIGASGCVYSGALPLIVGGGTIANSDWAWR